MLLFILACHLNSGLLCGKWIKLNNYTKTKPILTKAQGTHCKYIEKWQTINENRTARNMLHLMILSHLCIPYENNDHPYRQNRRTFY